MKAILQRFFHNGDETLGMLFVEGVPQCFILEDQPQAVKVYSETRIPAGTYKLAVTYSPKLTPKYGHDMILVCDVPGFEGIRIHPGLTDDDSAGCLLVGNSAHIDPTTKKVVLQESRLCYDRVYALMSAAILIKPESTITITNDMFQP